MQESLAAGHATVATINEAIPFAVAVALGRYPRTDGGIA
jgi:hypothetical protein